MKLTFCGYFMFSLLLSSTVAYAIEPSPVPESSIQTPAAEEVCFSPDESCDKKLIKFIQSAKVSIDIAIFDINLEKLTNELIVQSKKIAVRILVDRRQSGGQYSLVKKLIDARLKVRIGHQKKLMHNKFVIVDGKMLETGSFNFTAGATLNNDENQVYLTSPLILDRYKAHFERLWDRSDKPNL